MVAVWENRGYGGGAAGQYEAILQQSGVQLLQNKAVSIMLNNEDSLLFAGLDDELLGNPDITFIVDTFQVVEYRFIILMIYEPDMTDSYFDLGFQWMDFIS